MANGSHDLAQDLARRLRAARVISGKSVPELASDLGENWSTDKIYRVESGKQVPDALELAEFAQATGQPFEFFLASSSPEASEGAVLSDSRSRSQERGVA